MTPTLMFFLLYINSLRLNLMTLPYGVSLDNHVTGMGYNHHTPTGLWWNRIGKSAKLLPSKPPYLTRWCDRGDVHRDVMDYLNEI